MKWCWNALPSLTVESPVISYEHQVIAGDGQICWHRWTDRALFDQDGNIVAYQAVGEDITGQKKAKEALQASQEKYHSMVAALAEGIVLQDAEGSILSCNASAEHILGLTTDQMMGRTLFEPCWRVVHEDGSPFPGETHPAMMTLQTGKAYNDVIMGVHKPDGTLTWISINSVPLLLKSGQSQPYAVLTSFTDITKQKRAIEELQLQKLILEAQMEASPDGLLLSSPDRKWLHYNRQMVKMWNLPSGIEQALDSQTVVDYLVDSFVDPEAVQADIEYLHKHPDIEQQIEIQFKDGRTVERYSAPVKGLQGEYYGRIWSFRDVTQQKMLEAQLLQAQKMEAIGRLASGIAHDFNNFLVPMMSYAELSMMQIKPNSRVHTYLERIVESVERAADITHQILAFSRQQVLQVQVLDLNRIVRDFERMIRRLIGENIEIKLSLESKLFLISADKTQLEQVLMNLAVNARDAMPTGGQLTVETANVYLDEHYVKNYPEAEVGEFVMLTVNDTGRGMDEVTRQRVFDPFFTTKEIGKGTGLGLATVFGIIKQHHGNIWVSSKLGQGTTFRIYLPRVKNNEVTAVCQNANPSATNGTETILVVEDEELVREIIRETLVTHGYKVIDAAHAEEGLRLAREAEEPIHLLLTDVIMPGINGRQLAQKITSIHPHIRVLYMSGYADDIIVHHGILDEGIHFLEKPFNISDLTQKVRQTLS